MYDLNTVVHNILYSPSNQYGHAEDRVQAAKEQYQSKVSDILLQPTGASSNG